MRHELRRPNVPLDAQPAEGVRAVFLSHSAPSRILKVGSHHLSRELRLLGAEVAHVAAPVSLLHLANAGDVQVRRRIEAGLRGGRLDSDGVVQYVPFTLIPLSLLGERGRERVLSLPARWRASLFADWSEPDVVFVDQPLLGPLAHALSPGVVVYRPTDAHYDRRIREAEQALLRQSDGLVATSERVREEVLAGMNLGIPSVILENGVEYDRFAAPVAGLVREGFVYVGAVDRRFDWSLVDQLALAFPGVPIKIAGPVSAAPPMQLQPNVEVLGPVPYDSVPALLARARVGLLPYSSDPGNAGRSPMKYYEYLAAGLFVLATDSPALRGRQSPGVRLVATQAQAIRAGRELLAMSDNRAGRVEAAAFGWGARAQELINFYRRLEGRS